MSSLLATSKALSAYKPKVNSISLHILTPFCKPKELQTFRKYVPEFHDSHQVVNVAIDAVCYSRVLQKPPIHTESCTGRTHEILSFQPTCIFMATARPSLSTARCTCPMDAAANGFSSKVSSLSRQSEPSSFAKTVYNTIVV